MKGLDLLKISSIPVSIIYVICSSVLEIHVRTLNLTVFDIPYKFHLSKPNHDSTPQKYKTKTEVSELQKQDRGRINMYISNVSKMTKIEMVLWNQLHQ